MAGDTGRIISEYLFGTYTLTAQDLQAPEDSAAEIWKLLELAPEFVAEGVTVTVADLTTYIDAQALEQAEAGRELAEAYRYGDIDAGL